MFGDQRPEAARMIHVAGVGEFVHEQIARDIDSLEREASIHADRAAR